MRSLTQAVPGSVPAVLSGIVVLLLSTAVSAQQLVGAVAGVVRDSTGKPIAGVEVLLPARRSSARSDSAGAYRLAGLQAGKTTLSFRRFGFEPQTVPATITAGATVTMNVVMGVLVQELPGMLVLEREERARKALQDFYHRRESMTGFFLTRDEIEKRNPLNMSDMLRLMPGATLIASSGGQSVLRFARSTLPGRDCPPQYYIDGIMAAGFNIDDIEPEDVEGVEVYTGAARIPPQFNNSRIGTSICGVVVLWTRVPGA